MTHPLYKFIHLANIRTTIAYRINDDAHTITYAVATAGPKDEYRKDIGRKIATGRIEKGGSSTRYNRERAITVSMDVVGGSTKYNDIKDYLIDTVLHAD